MRAPAGAAGRRRGLRLAPLAGVAVAHRRRRRRSASDADAAPIVLSIGHVSPFSRGPGHRHDRRLAIGGRSIRLTVEPTAAVRRGRSRGCRVCVRMPRHGVPRAGAVLEVMTATMRSAMTRPSAAAARLGRAPARRRALAPAARPRRPGRGHRVERARRRRARRRSTPAFVGEVFLFALVGPVAVALTLRWVARIIDGYRATADALETMNRSLEAKVAERTRHLEAATAQLAGRRTTTCVSSTG